MKVVVHFAMIVVHSYVFLEAIEVNRDIILAKTFNTLFDVQQGLATFLTADQCPPCKDSVGRIFTST